MMMSCAIFGKYARAMIDVLLLLPSSKEKTTSFDLIFKDDGRRHGYSVTRAAGRSIVEGCCVLVPPLSDTPDVNDDRETIDRQLAQIQ